jgi:hypothetical protein
MVAECPEPSTMSWQRHATDAEGDALIASGDLPPGFDTSVLLLPVDACDDHRVNDDLAALVHAADCTAPPAADGECDCTPDPAEPDDGFSP